MTLGRLRVSQKQDLNTYSDLHCKPYHLTELTTHVAAINKRNLKTDVKFDLSF